MGDDIEATALYEFSPNLADYRRMLAVIDYEQSEVLSLLSPERIMPLYNPPDW